MQISPSARVPLQSGGWGVSPRSIPSSPVKPAASESAGPSYRNDPNESPLSSDLDSDLGPVVRQAPAHAQPSSSRRRNRAAERAARAQFVRHDLGDFIDRREEIGWIAPRNPISASQAATQAQDNSPLALAEGFQRLDPNAEWPPLGTDADKD